MKKKTDLEKYMTAQARFWEDRRNDEAFARADKKEREREARKCFDKFYKEYFRSSGHSGDQIAEICSSAPNRALIAALKARPELALGKVALRASGDSGFSPTSAGSRFRLPSRFQTRRGPGAPVLSSFVFLDTTRRATGLRRPLRADVCNAAKTGRRTTRPERED